MSLVVRGVNEDAASTRSRLDALPDGSHTRTSTTMTLAVGMTAGSFGA